MRAELEANGVALPGADELRALSKTFNKKLEAARHKIGSMRARDDAHSKDAASWYNLFREIDEDGSGFVTYDELEVVCRRKLGFTKEDLSTKDLKALWCVLDADDSDAIHLDEMSAFLRANVELLLDESRRRVKPPPQIISRPNPLRPRRKKERPAFDREAYAKAQVEAHEARLANLNWRLAEVAKQERETHLQQMRRVKVAKDNGMAKQSLLTEMRLKLLRSPIPDELPTCRLGAGRIVPLYQSERMLAKLEAANGRIEPSFGSPSRYGSPRNSPPPTRGGMERPDFDLRTISAGPTTPAPRSAGGARPVRSHELSPMRGSKDDVLLDAALGRLRNRLLAIGPTPSKRGMQSSASLPAL